MHPVPQFKFKKVSFLNMQLTFLLLSLFLLFVHHHVKMNPCPSLQTGPECCLLQEAQARITAVSLNSIDDTHFHGSSYHNASIMELKSIQEYRESIWHKVGWINTSLKKNGCGDLFICLQLQQSPLNYQRALLSTRISASV